jgi:hypothetical protein
MIRYSLILFAVILGPPRPGAPPTTVAEFQALRWLEGRWRGTHAGEPFYQSYHFRNDSTIDTRTFGDSSFHEASDSGTIVLENGVIKNRGGGAEWEATSLDSRTIHFEPAKQAQNSFTWHRISRTQWSATIRWHDASGQEQHRLYMLDRVGS